MSTNLLDEEKNLSANSNRSHPYCESLYAVQLGDPMKPRATKDRVEVPETNGHLTLHAPPQAESNVSSSDRTALRSVLQAVKAVRRGDFSIRVASGSDGVIAEIGEALNDVIELNELMSKEFVRAAHIVGREGKMTERAN